MRTSCPTGAWANCAAGRAGLFFKVPFPGGTHPYLVQEFPTTFSVKPTSALRLFPRVARLAISFFARLELKVSDDQQRWCLGKAKRSPLVRWSGDRLPARPLFT